jgi:hypothetical protein
LPSSPSIARPHLVVAVEGEAHAVDRGQRQDRCQDLAGRLADLDRAAAHLTQQVVVAAELAVGEDVELHAPVRLLADPLGDRSACLWNGCTAGVL